MTAVYSVNQLFFAQKFLENKFFNMVAFRG